MITCNGPELTHCHCLTFRLNMNRVTRSIGYIIFFLTFIHLFSMICEKYSQWLHFTLQLHFTGIVIDSEKSTRLGRWIYRNSMDVYKCQWEIDLCRLSIFHCRFFVWSAFNKDLNYSYAFRRNIVIFQKDILHTRWATRKTPTQFGWLLFRVSLKKVNDLIMEEFADTWAKLDIWKISIAF